MAHGGLNRADPAPGAALGASPKNVRLFFTEPPEATLSDIAVVDLKGAAYQAGRPEAVAGDPLSLTVPLRRLERGVYIVNWRVVSAVDGHTTSGSYAFGVGVVPTIAATSAATIVPPTPLEVGARWLLLTGLIILTGATVAAVTGLGGIHDLPLAAAGWLVTTIGLALFAAAQMRSAGMALSALWSVAIGRALIWRALAIMAAGMALLAARVRPARRREACGAAAVAAAVAIAVHVAAGHAATNTEWRLAARVFAQWAHVVAIGVWLGGLLALLAGIRGEPSEAKAIAIGRFSRLAAFALAIVIATGLARTYGELAGWRDLIATDYGKAVMLKIGATAAIAAVAAINRWHSVIRARFTLRPLPPSRRRRARSCDRRAPGGGGARHVAATGVGVRRASIAAGVRIGFWHLGPSRAHDGIRSTRSQSVHRPRPGLRLACGLGRNTGRAAIRAARRS